MIIITLRPPTCQEIDPVILIIKTASHYCFGRPVITIMFGYHDENENDHSGISYGWQ